MMERHEYTNPWADKLQEVQLPDANDSWNAMEVLLDKEMPSGGQYDKRRWLLVILLLLLLIGVCNCPRQGRWSHRGPSGGPLPASDSSARLSDSLVRLSDHHRSAGPAPIRPSTGKTSLGPAPVNRSGGYGPAPSGIPPGNSAPSGTSPGNSSPSGILTDKGIPSDVSTDNGTRSSVPAAGPRGNSSVPKSARRIGGRDKRATGATGTTGTTGKGAVKKVTGGRGVVEEGTGGNDVVKEGDTGGNGNVKKRTGGKGIVTDGASGNGSGEKASEENEDGKKEGKNTVGTPGTTGASTAAGTPDSIGTPTTVGNPVTARTTTAGSAGKKGKDSTATAAPKPGGNTIAKKKPAAVPDNKQTSAGKKPAEDTTAIEPDVYGWVAGIGFNQFFSVGQQQKSEYNSGGTTGGIGDYLPIPMVRYYFSRKLFVQMEAQFNAPQYTKKDLVAGLSAGVTLPSGHVQQNSVVIKKLFYFNLPVSIHYSPIRNLYLGGGVQYSRLSNGVGLYEDKVLVPGGSDTVKAAKLYSFKGDSIYQKMRTNEFRLLLDLNYTYKRFIIGARYNQALSKFINVRLSDAQVTQARNSSLQLYIRYILWDGRKRKALSSK